MSTYVKRPDGTWEATARGAWHLKACTQTMVRGTLPAGATSITLSSQYITDDCYIIPYTGKYGVAVTDIVATPAADGNPGTAVLTLPAQTAALEVGIGIIQREPV